MARVRIWIDPDSGTWGTSRVLVADVPEEDLAALADLSDTQRMKLAATMQAAQQQARDSDLEFLEAEVHLPRDL